MCWHAPPPRLRSRVALFFQTHFWWLLLHSLPAPLCCLHLQIACFLVFSQIQPKMAPATALWKRGNSKKHVYRCIKSQKSPPSTIIWSTAAVITRPTLQIVCTTCCSSTRIWFSPISTYYSRTPWPSPASIWHGIAVRSTSSNSPTICLHQWTIELISTRQFTLSVHLNEPQCITSICAWSFWFSGIYGTKESLNKSLSRFTDSQSLVCFDVRPPARTEWQCAARTHALRAWEVLRTNAQKNVFKNR